MRLSHEDCESLASTLQSPDCPLRELSLRNMSIGSDDDDDDDDDGLKVLCSALTGPHCNLETLRLKNCFLTANSCEALASALSSNSQLSELDLSLNDLQDSGVKLLSGGLKSPNCRLKTLRLSSCRVTEEGCAALASALRSNPSYLRELDLSFNHPGDLGVNLLSDPLCRLEKLNVDHNEEIWVKPQLLKKYACDLSLDPNTAHIRLSLSEDNRRVEWVKEKQPYPDHPERFDKEEQVLCREGLTGRHYWEVDMEGDVYIGVTYKSISRKGFSWACGLGYNDKSWSLIRSGQRCFVWHNHERTVLPAWIPQSSRVGVYLDCPAGVLSFYSISSDTMTHLYTFHTTFTEPLYPAFKLNPGTSAHLCQEYSMLSRLDEAEDLVEPSSYSGTLQADDACVQLRRHFSRGASRPLPRPRSWPSPGACSGARGREECVTGSLSRSCPNLLIPVTSEDFTPDIVVHENERAYRFRFPHAGMFQCRRTGLAFVMEGEGELLYRTVSWDRKLLAHRGKRPAGPLFKFTCLKGSACQLHLPHCEVHSEGGCDHLSVIHVTGRHVGFKRPYMTTDTHVIVNIAGFCKLGLAKDEDAPVGPVRAIVVVFHQLPPDPERESKLNVLLLPKNVDIDHVIDVRTKRNTKNGQREIYIETTASRCRLLPEQGYALWVDQKLPVQPKEYVFEDQEDYANFIVAFQVFVPRSVKTVQLILRKCTSGVLEFFFTSLSLVNTDIWESIIPLQDSPTESTSTAASTFTDLLIHTLDGLESGDLKKFQRHLWQPGQSFDPFRRFQLENLDREKTVDLMVDKFCREAVDVTIQILRKMDNNNLAKELENKYRGV